MLEAGGAQLVEILRLNALEARCSPQTAADWAELRAWLGSGNDALSPAAVEKLNRAWRGYLAAGIAPSLKLQPSFRHYAEQAKSTSLPIESPPSSVTGVFDRMLASDADIRVKRLLDGKSSHVPPAGVPKTPQHDWWRAQTRWFRTWVFACVVWIIGVALFVLVFDPYNNGSLSYMDSDEVAQVLLVMALPVMAGIAKVAYDKFVR